MIKTLAMNMLTADVGVIDELSLAAILLIFLFLIYINIRQNKKN